MDLPAGARVRRMWREHGAALDRGAMGAELRGDGQLEWTLIVRARELSPPAP